MWYEDTIRCRVIPAILELCTRRIPPPAHTHTRAQPSVIAVTTRQQQGLDYRNPPCTSITIALSAPVPDLLRALVAGSRCVYETYVGTLAWRSLTLVPLSDYRVASVHVNDIKAVSNVFAAPLAHSRVCAFNSQNFSSSVFFTALPRVDRE